MNSESPASTGHRVLLQLPVFGPEGLALALKSSDAGPGPETYVTLLSRANDIVLYLGILWEKGEVVLSRRIADEWRDQVTQNHPLTGGQASVCLTIRPGSITVAIGDSLLVEWPLDVFFAEVIALHASGAWVLESKDAPGEQSVLPDTVLPDLPVHHDLLGCLQSDLIFDFGMHNSDDTDYYLKKGFRVVAVDANPTLCGIAAVRHADAVKAGRLTICNIGVAPTRGNLSFFVNQAISEWSSFDREIASRGHPVVELKVRTALPEDFFKAFGVPRYCKIDIEGFDRLVVEGIARLPVKPPYVSFENGVVRDFETLVAAGYVAFQMVEQSGLPSVKLPQTSEEGNSIEHVFAYGSSGPFGKDLPGAWLGMEEARSMLEAHHHELATRPDRGYDWWDLHARHQNA